MSLRIQTWQGQQILSIFDQLACLRIEVFKEYPYLYQGSFDYEKSYLSRYAECPRSFVVGVWDNQQLVGASTALPLVDEEEFIQRPFKDERWPLDQILYFGESLLLPSHRGQGLGHLFFDQREDFANHLQLPITCFCSVIRSSDHPARPKNYRSHELFWKKRGYENRAELTTEFQWQDTDQNYETKKPMQFWVKK